MWSRAGQIHLRKQLHSEVKQPETVFSVTHVQKLQIEPGSSISIGGLYLSVDGAGNLKSPTSYKSKSKWGRNKGRPKARAKDALRTKIPPYLRGNKQAGRPSTNSGHQDTLVSGSQVAGVR